jgi:hypothetical protein
MRIQPTKDLAECIQKIINDYGKTFVMDDLFASDEIRIRRRGPADNFKPEDEVGVYADDDYIEGKITEETIRKDVQNWLQKRGKVV